MDISFIADGYRCRLNTTIKVAFPSDFEPSLSFDTLLKPFGMPPSLANTAFDCQLPFHRSSFTVICPWVIMYFFYF